MDSRVEIQLRARYQHAWATADRRRFERSSSSRLRQAMVRRNGSASRPHGIRHCPSWAGPAGAEYPLGNTAHGEIREYVERLDVTTSLRAYGAALDVSRGSDLAGSRYFLLELHPSEGVTRVTGFTKQQRDRAMVEYLRAEQALAGPGDEAVLVYSPLAQPVVASVSKLRSRHGALSGSGRPGAEVNRSRSSPRQHLVVPRDLRQNRHNRQIALGHERPRRTSMSSHMAPPPR